MALSSDVNLLQLQFWIACILKTGLMKGLRLTYAKQLFPTIMVRSAQNICVDSWNVF